MPGWVRLGSRGGLPRDRFSLQLSHRAALHLQVLHRTGAAQDSTGLWLPDLEDLRDLPVDERLGTINPL